MTARDFPPTPPAPGKVLLAGGLAITRNARELSAELGARWSDA